MERRGTSTSAGHGARAVGRRRARVWLHRYLPPELAGTAAVALAAGLAAGAGAGGAALAAAWAETVAYYLIVTGRQLRAAPGRSRLHRALRTVRGVLAEFGLAEVADTLILRPLLMYAFVAPLGSVVAGVVVGKLVAELAFYALVIPAYELRLRRASG